jgi:hypothetical protein
VGTLHREASWPLAVCFPLRPSTPFSAFAPPTIYLKVRAISHELSPSQPRRRDRAPGRILGANLRACQWERPDREQHGLSRGSPIPISGTACPLSPHHRSTSAPFPTSLTVSAIPDLSSYHFSVLLDDVDRPSMSHISARLSPLHLVWIGRACALYA